MTGNPQPQQLRFELEQLRTRYDSGAVSPAVYQVVRELETEIAWAQHRRNKPAVRVTPEAVRHYGR
jgi:hypothetical protein